MQSQVTAAVAMPARVKTRMEIPGNLVLVTTPPPPKVSLRLVGQHSLPLVGLASYYHLREFSAPSTRLRLLHKRKPEPGRGRQYCTLRLSCGAQDCT